jgi:hypothetical protein
VDDEPVTRSGHDRVRGLARSHNAPDLLYGAIVAGSVLAVSSAHADETAHVALATALVTLIYWLAHVYVEAIGGRFTDVHQPIHRRIGEAMRDAVEVLIGAVPPVLIFLLARVAGADVQSAAQIALWITVGLLMAAGAAAAYLAGQRGWPLALESLIAGCFGLLVIALKYLLH